VFRIILTLIVWRVSSDFVTIIKGKKSKDLVLEDKMEVKVTKIIEDHYNRAPHLREQDSGNYDNSQNA